MKATCLEVYMQGLKQLGHSTKKIFLVATNVIAAKCSAEKAQASWYVGVEWSPPKKSFVLSVISNRVSVSLVALSLSLSLSRGSSCLFELGTLRNQDETVTILIEVCAPANDGASLV